MNFFFFLAFTAEALTSCLPANSIKRGEKEMIPKLQKEFRKHRNFKNTMERKKKVKIFEALIHRLSKDQFINNSTNAILNKYLRESHE